MKTPKEIIDRIHEVSSSIRSLEEGDQEPMYLPIDLAKIEIIVLAWVLGLDDAQIIENGLDPKEVNDLKSLANL